MMENKQAPKSSLDTKKIIGDTLVSFTEALTGIASSEKKDWFLSLGHLLQSFRGGRFLKTFQVEWNSYCEQGRIADGYTDSEQHQECLQELLDFLDHKSPDNARFTALKKILLVAAQEKISTRESILPQQYMKIVRQLQSSELLILLATYQLSKEANIDSGGKADRTHKWINIIAERTGLKYPELVEANEDGLIALRLITPRKYPDKSGIDLGDHYRLTQLGFDLCEYIEKYDENNQS
jgi:hypothetical protein